jgi:tRNA-Thr(GGU) m(6)t(6)A37 methyltransferase TsaA
MGIGAVGRKTQRRLAVRALATARGACQFAVMSETTKPADPTHRAPENGDAYGLREGEISAELPAQPDAELYYIGRIRTPWKRREDCPKNARGSDEVCTVELDPRWAQGLRGLETVTHVLLLYWMDQARRDLVLQWPRHYAEHRGTFALRSPARPNPIAVSVARLIGIDGSKLSVIGVDCLDDTPLLDIKPYFASTDSVPDARVGWHADRQR